MTKKIMICATTRDRPKMFDALLASLVKIEHPAGVVIVFCFVENASTLSIDQKVKAFAKASGCQAKALCEPRLGIPFARNAAVDAALAAGADFMAFIDDDECASKDWLVRLYEAAIDRKLDLVGGPVIPAVKHGLRADQNLVLKGLHARAERVAKTNERKQWDGTDANVTIVTNNWLCRTALLRQEMLRFDETLGYSNGSDTAFFRTAKSSGARTGWASKASVTENIALERLSFSYQFARGRDQSISNFHIRHQEPLKIKHLIVSLLIVCLKLILGVVRLLGSIVSGGRSLVLAMRAFGSAWGRVLAVFGRASRHYEKTLGS